MIDGIKCWDVITNFENDKIKINGLCFRLNQLNNHSISGSIHKFSNDGMHNADDYPLSRVKKTFIDLYDNFNIDPTITKLNSLEFGVNIHLNIHPDIVLQSILLFHNKTGNRQKDYIEFPLETYSLKVYSKSAIGSSNLFLSGAILRIEIHVNKMRFFKRYNLPLDVLSDLLNVKVFEQFEQILIQSINDCLIAYLPEEDCRKLDEKSLSFYYKYTNPIFWLNLKGSKKNREIKKLNQFIREYSSVNVKDILIQLIQEKCKELRDVESANKINASWNENTQIPNHTPSKKRCFSSNSGCITNIPKWKDNTIQIKGVSVPHISKYYSHCRGCGKVINNPRRNQLYCSAADVGRTDARRCRDKVNRPIDYLKNRLIKIFNYPVLFDPTPYIEHETLQFLERQKLLNIKN